MSEQETLPHVHVVIRDETVPRSDVIEALFPVSAIKLTARELITERVLIECEKRLFDDKGRVAPLLIERAEKEKTLNGPIKHHVHLPSSDDELQEQLIAIALHAFETNGFILLVNDVQIENLDDEIEIEDKTVITFLKLTPLAGG